MELSKRIRAARESMSDSHGRKWSQADLANALGVTPQAVQKWEKSRSKPTLARLRDIARVCRVDEAWLTTGRGHPEGLEIPEGVAEPSAQYDDGSPSELSAAVVMRRVPLISWVQAGEFAEAEDPYALGEAEEWIPVYSSISNHAFALRVDGDSMTNPFGSPTFPPGTTLIVDPERRAESGNFVIARLEPSGDVTFKQLRVDAGTTYLMPLNPRYQAITVNSPMRICGVVVAIAQVRLV